MKAFVVLFAFLLPIIGWSSSVSFTAQYREAANIFVIMDCVSGWWDGNFCADRGAYRTDWINRFGLTSEELQSFSDYDAFRNRYFKGLGMPADPQGPFSDGIFSQRASISEDLIAPVFYSSNTLEEAFEKLASIVSDEDLIFIESFYERFKTKYQALLVESSVFIEKARTLNQNLQNPSYADFFSKISGYYSVSEPLSYEVLLTWFPPLERDLAHPVDRFLILHKNPIVQLEWNDEEIVFHEVVHTLSARQPQEQKETLSKIILDQCPIEEWFPRGKKGKILEEPMAVTIGQILFLKEFFPERLRWDSDLYSSPWVSAFAKLIYPVIQEDFAQNQILSPTTAQKIGFLCNEILQTSNLLHP